MTPTIFGLLNTDGTNWYYNCTKPAVGVTGPGLMSGALTPPLFASFTPLNSPAAFVQSYANAAITLAGLSANSDSVKGGSIPVPSAPPYKVIALIVR